MQSSSKPTASLTWTWKGVPYTLPISASDMLMLARAIEHEGYPEEGVAWAMLQRAAWLSMLGKPINLGALVQAYSQPINPVWFANGAKHAAEMDRLRRIGDYEGAQRESIAAERRTKQATKPWEALSANTKSLVERLLRGQSKSPVKGAVHFWASRGPHFATNQAAQPAFILLDRGFGFGKGRNVFFAVKGSENFGGVSVRHGEQAWPGPTPLAPDRAASLALAGGLAIVAGLAAWKWR